MDTAKAGKVPSGLSGILKLRGVPSVEGSKSALALDAAALFFVANLPAKLFFQRFQQVKGDVGRLKALGVGVGNVMHQRSESRGAGNRNGLGSGSKARCIQTGEHAAGNGFGVALDT